MRGNFNLKRNTFHRTGACKPIGPLVLTILLMGLAACGGPKVKTRLIDALHEPVILVEGRGISLPASKKGNRFIKGWRDRARRNDPQLEPRGEARIQIVHLEQRSRKLTLKAAIRPHENGTVEYRVDGRPWQSIPLKRKMELVIPQEQKLGRVNLDLRLPEGNELVVKSLELKRKDKGEVQVTDAGDLVQSGYSLAELVRQFDQKTEVSGSFRSPTRAQAGQRFWLQLETSEGQKKIFEWQQGIDVDGVSSFSSSVPAGFGRFQFFAQGAGPAAEWRGLTVRAGKEGPPPLPAAPEPPKLIVLYIMDALRSDYLGHLGGPEGVSPTIDRLADQGTTFVNHFSVAPNTVPSTKSILTGQKFLLKGGHKLDRASGPTLAERFHDAGYRTGLFSGNGNVSSWLGMTRGFETDSSKVLWRGSKSRRAAGYNNNAEVIHRETLAWLDQLETTDRAFVHIQTVHPHNPYDPPEPFLSQFAPENGSTISGSTDNLKGIRTHRVKVNNDDKERLKGLYTASVAYNDAHIDTFIDQVLQRYDKKEVLFFLTSDHGEELFERGGVLHGYTLYDEMLRIPLVAWWPGTVAKGRVEELTDNVDLQSTLAGLIAGSQPDNPVTGDSLWPYMDGRRRAETPDKDVVFAAAASVKGGIFMARSKRYKVVYAPRQGSRGGGRWGMGQGRGRGFDAEYVFDLESDPEERVNLAGEPLMEADWLWQRLMSWIDVGTRIEAGEELGELDEETEESLRALGYL